MNPTIAKLRLAKKYSDQGNFPAKARILSEMMREDPKAFIIDSRDHGHPGITHVKTRFKFHVPRKYIPADIQVKFAETIPYGGDFSLINHIPPLTDVPGKNTM